MAKGPFRVRLPGDWRALFGNTAGRVRLWRRFGRPTHLQPGQSVQVVVPPAVGLLRVRVNERLERGTDTRGAVSGFAAPVRLEVSHLLRTNNLLELWLELDPDRTDAAGGLPAPIVLEIHGPPQTA
ncbi:MAG: hypothetical protein D6725_10680 [Planctomycetota bacterium]|nr:MAG: hypothetical protein D6725_10680 [Planctomycetota bacterium]